MLILAVALEHLAGPLQLLAIVATLAGTMGIAIAVLQTSRTNKTIELQNDAIGALKSNNEALTARLGILEAASEAERKACEAKITAQGQQLQTQQTAIDYLTGVGAVERVTQLVTEHEQRIIAAIARMAPA